jgi:hypothetical protein
MHSACTGIPSRSSAGDMPASASTAWTVATRSGSPASSLVSSTYSTGRPGTDFTSSHARPSIHRPMGSESPVSASACRHRSWSSESSARFQRNNACTATRLRSGTDTSGWYSRSISPLSHAPGMVLARLRRSRSALFRCSSTMSHCRRPLAFNRRSVMSVARRISAGVSSGLGWCSTAMVAVAATPWSSTNTGSASSSLIRVASVAHGGVVGPCSTSTPN